MSSGSGLAAVAGLDADTLRAGLTVVIPALGTACTVRQARTALAAHFGRAADGLDSQADQITDLIKEQLQSVPGEPAAVGPKKIWKRQFLGTWSHTDDTNKKAPRSVSKADFGDILLRMLAGCFEAATNGPKRTKLNQVLRVSVWEEKHQNGMPHYHFPVLAEHPWYSDTLQRTLRAEGMYVEFSSDHDYYWTSFLYVAVPCAMPGGKAQADLDEDPWLSAGHPSVRTTLEDMPRGARSADKARARRSLGESGRQGSGKGGVALTDKEFSAHVVAKGLRTITELLAWVRTGMTRRKDLLDDERFLLVGMEAYCYQHQTELGRRISFAWELEDAPRVQELRGKRAWEMVSQALEFSCECGGVWIPRTEKLLEWHCAAFPAHVPQEERPVSQAVRNAIERALKDGCQKHTNVFLYGPNTSGKSHVLKPLMGIFSECCFLRPVGKGNYPLQELFGAKVCILQDVRASTFKLAWDDMLVWFEGEQFPVPMPRNRHDKDKVYMERAPVFVSTGSKFRIPAVEAERLQVNADEQSRMMDSRFRMFLFPRSLTEQEKIVTPACKRCFATWLTSGPESLGNVAPEPAAPLGQGSTAQLAAEAVSDWIETHGGELRLSGPQSNLSAMADALRWSCVFLPSCGRLLAFLRHRGCAKPGEPDVLVSAA